MGSCFIFLPSVYNSRFDTFGSLSCNTWTRWSSATYLLFCDAMINYACAMINPAGSHFADVHFPLCMSLSSYTFTCIVDCHHKLKWISKYNLPCAFAFQKQINLYAHLQGEPLQLMKTIPYPLQFHRLCSSLKTSTSLSSITKKGEIVSASSATPSWFWSIDDKPSWGTNAFVRIAG